MKKLANTASRKALYKLLRPCRSAGLALAALTALQAMLWVLMAWATRGVINAALDDKGKFLFWCAALLALSVSIPLLRGGTNALAGQVTDRGASRLRRDMLELLEHKDCEKLNGYHSGQLFSRVVGDCRTLCEKYTGLLPGVAGQVVQLLAAAVALLVLRPGLVVLLLLCGGAAAAVGILLRRVLKARHLAVRKADERLTSCLQEDLEHLELNRSIAAEGEVLRRFDHRQADWMQARKAQRRVSVGGNSIFSLVIQLGSAAVIIWGALAIRNEILLFGDLTAIIQLLNLFRSPVSGLTGVQSRLAAVDAAEERVLQLWELPEEFSGETVAADAACRSLIFEHVTFSYEGEESPVFRDFSARVDLDRWTCLTGASGRGKSTLYRLILGLFRPQSGRILLETDGGTVECSAATRKLFSFVPQAPTLFSGSLRENLLLANPEASDRALWAALEQAECGFVRELPEGLDTVLGENGEGLSVGQRQRVAIARALLSGAQVLLLDEITSALDHETEARLLDDLARAYPAALIATHRPESLHTDEIRFLDLEDGGRSMV